MPKLFVGYARPDRDQVRPIVHALEAVGMEVWWDPELAPGSDFVSEIQRQLKAADHVLICWSSAGARSTWLSLEADYALAAGKLLMARLDDTAFAAPYAGRPTVDLSDWTGELEHDDFTRLLVALGTPQPETSPRSRKPALS